MGRIGQPTPGPSFPAQSAIRVFLNLSLDIRGANHPTFAMSSHSSSIPNRNSNTNPTSRNGATPASPGAAGNHPKAPQPASPVPLDEEPMTNRQRRLVCKQIALDPTRKGTERIAAIRLDLLLAKAEAEAETENKKETADSASGETSPKDGKRGCPASELTSPHGPAEGAYERRPAAASPLAHPSGHSANPSIATPGAASPATGTPAPAAPPPSNSPHSAANSSPPLHHKPSGSSPSAHPAGAPQNRPVRPTPPFNPKLVRALGGGRGR